MALAGVGVDIVEIARMECIRPGLRGASLRTRSVPTVSEPRGLRHTMPAASPRVRRYSRRWAAALERAWALMMFA